MVAIVVAGLVATYGIWTFGRDPGRDSEADQARASLAANAWAQVVRCKAPCQVNGLHQVAGPVWEARLGDECWQFDIDRFKLEESQGGRRSPLRQVKARGK
jgi:hypothetical protein